MNWVSIVKTKILRLKIKTLKEILKFKQSLEKKFKRRCFT